MGLVSSNLSFFEMVRFSGDIWSAKRQTKCASQFIQGLAARELKHFELLEWHLHQGGKKVEENSHHVGMDLSKMLISFITSQT